MTPGIAEIRRAADVIRGHVLETPCVLSRTLSEITGGEGLSQVREPAVHGVVQGARRL